MICVQPASIRFNADHIPLSQDYADTYYSLQNPLEECRHVFLAGNNLPARWQTADSFRIAEIGFGTGRNFLLTAQLWLQLKPANGVLHYFAIEQHPVTRADLAHLFSCRTIDAALEAQLLGNYPMPTRGFHPISLANDRIRLLLVFDDAQRATHELGTKFDAWYLDGFAPACNPSAWETSLFSEIFQHTLPRGTAATYSAASRVRKSLSDAGFMVQRKAGFGLKREMLTACRPAKQSKITKFARAYLQWPDCKPVHTLQSKITIIGAGLAGCSLAFALCQRGCQVDLIEGMPSVAQGASGNPAAILMPRQSLDHDHQSRLTCSGYQYTIRWLTQLNHRGFLTGWQPCGALQIARDAQQQQRMHRIVQQENFSSEWMQTVDALTASRLSGCDIHQSAWFFPGAGFINPKTLCNTLISACGNRLQLVTHTSITALSRTRTHWALHTAHNQSIECGGPVIIACGHLSRLFTQTQYLPIKPKRGQVTLVATGGIEHPPQCIISADGYITPAIDGYHTIGATFVSNDSTTHLRHTENLHNLQKIQQAMPELGSLMANNVKGRAAVRAVSPDRLPLVGPVSDVHAFEQQYAPLARGNTRSGYSDRHYLDDLYAFTAFGSRGLAWIPLCAEFMAAKLMHEPPPIEHSLVNALHPNRFLFAALKKKLNAVN